MTQVRLDDIQRGWKVFAGSEEVGEVESVEGRHLDVQRGLLFKHSYRIPETYIAEAADGVVDLGVDLDVVERLERGSDRSDQAAKLPEEYQRLEMDDVSPSVEPRDPGPFAR